MSHITQILSQIESGDPTAAEELLPLVYDELRKLAAQKMTQEKPGQTLQATALVHEAYLRLIGTDKADEPWENRGHFFAAAAEAMRRILVENARRKQGPKHGGGHQRAEVDSNTLIDASAVLPNVSALDLLALDEALTRLALEAPDRAELVTLRFFAGLNMADSASVLGVSLATAERQWSFARAWLYAELSELNDEDTPHDKQVNDTQDD